MKLLALSGLHLFWVIPSGLFFRTYCLNRMKRFCSARVEFGGFFSRLLFDECIILDILNHLLP